MNKLLIRVRSCLLCFLFVMQFYTFLETSLVTLSLLQHFIAFFSDGEIPGTPGTLVTTFLAFGTVTVSLSILSLLISAHC